MNHLLKARIILRVVLAVCIWVAVYQSIQNYLFAQKDVVDIETFLAQRIEEQPLDPEPLPVNLEVMEPVPKTYLKRDQLLHQLVKGSFFFDWNDWMVFGGESDAFQTGHLSIERYPTFHRLRPWKITYPWRKRLAAKENRVLGLVYCEHILPAPSKVVALEEPAVIHDQYKVPLAHDVHHASPARSHKQYGHRMQYEGNVGLPILQQLQSPHPRDRLVVDIPKSMFDWIPPKKDRKHPTVHSVTVWSALSDVKDSKKHFFEPMLTKDPTRHGLHYDWRFFRKVLGPEEQTFVNQNLMRTWAQFTESFGISWWLAHGSLLGWYWNGMLMPWDTDNDIQMPIVELDRLAKEFNRTLVVQHPSEGTGKYLLDVSPWYVERTTGNKQNLIDARFIDIETGFYIDITGLANTQGTGSYNCKNFHMLKYEHITPLRRTLYEGYPVYVPNNYTAILQKEYKNFTAPVFKAFAFNSKLRLWSLQKTCKEYLQKYRRDDHVYCWKNRPADPKECPRLRDKYGTCDLAVIERFKQTQNLTLVHRLELDAFASGNWGAITDLQSHYYPPLSE